MLTVLVYLHLSACLWFLLVAKDERWVPPLNDRQPFGMFYDETDFWHQYTTSLYHSVILFIGKDIRPVGSQQLLFVSGVLLIGSLLNANIFGNIALIILDLKFKTIQEQEIIDTSNTAMKGIRLDISLNTRIVTYLRANLGNADF